MPAEVLLPAGLVLALDQVSKALVQSQPNAGRVGSGWRAWIRPVRNPRLGAGCLRDRRLLVVVWGAAVLGTTWLTQNATALQEPVAQIGLGAAVGGATGNLLDALRRGAVVDFIDLRVWPVFNLADVAIVLGVLAALWSLG